MKSKGNYMLQQCLVLFVMTIYLLVVSMHIFYLPRTTSFLTNTHNSIFKRKVESVLPNNFLERTDKATFKETVKDLVQTTPVLYLDFLFAGLTTKDFQLIYLPVNSQSFYNHRYAYLSFSIFRI
jgi:hypothetical protein